MRKFLWQIPLALTIISGIFLRVYKIGSNYFFTGELGKELLYIRQFSINHTLPLVGMTTSHEWLSYGPFYYWIMIPIFNLVRGNPFVLFWAALSVATIGMIINYFIIRKIINEKVAFISTLIQAFSPLFIWQTRLSKLHVFFFILSPLLMYALWKIWNGKKNWLFWSGLIFGLMFSFHFSQIPLLVVVAVLIYLKRKIYRFKDFLKIGFGMLIPNLTFLWQDRSLALWLPYRIVNLADKNPLGTWQAFLEYFGKNIFWESRFWFLGLIIFCLIFGHYILANKKFFKKEFVPFYLTSTVGIMILSNVLHGAFPIHYFLPIFTALPILFAIYLAKTRYWSLILVPVIAINLFSFSKDTQFYGSAEKFISGIDFVPYSLQDLITSFIVRDAGGRELSIKRIGPYDYFPEEYSQNYKYLILWKKGKLVENSANVYTITEDTEKSEVYVQKQN